MSSSPESVIALRICPVCNGGLSRRSHYLGMSGDSTVVYSCENTMCCAYVHPYTRYMATYENDIDRVSAQIILDIDKVNYRLAFNSQKNITTLGKLVYFIEPTSEYIHKEICTINSVIEWYDALSAYQVITRLLNIKAFS